MSNLTSSGADEAPLGKAAEVLRLSPEAVSSERKVHLRGVITCYVPASQLAFVQDDTAGIYFQPTPWPKDLNPGDLVEVQGFTRMGRFSPIVQLATVQVIGKSASPPALDIPIEDLNTGKFDCRLVRIHGVVREHVTQHDHTRLEIYDGGSRATALIFGSTPIADLVDAEISIQGVAGTLYDRERLTGFAIFSVAPSQIKIGRPPGKPFSGPVRPARDLVWYSPEGEMEHRVHLSGTVTAVLPEGIIMRDASGAIKIDAESEGLSPGDEVEVSGFVKSALATPEIVNGLIKRTGAKGTVEPEKESLKEVLRDPKMRHELLLVEGTAAGVVTGDAGVRILVESDGAVVTALARGKMESVLEPGSQLRFPAVYLGGEANPNFIIPDTDKIVVTQTPKVAIVPNDFPGMLAVTAVSGVALSAGLGAMCYMLARRKNQLKRSQAKNRQRLAETEEALQKLASAREKLGRDLHDHVIQSVYAIGLNLEDAQQLAAAHPEKTEGKLKTVLLEINGVLRELRNIVLGLESEAIQPQEFRAALKSIALTLGHEQSNKIRLDLDQGALGLLTPGQATEFVHIAREAMSNSLRHGKAQTTTVVLQATGESIRFMIEDDGKGFRVDANSGSGFGLRNMARRAENLGASFQITSEVGKGTRIVLDIPKQKQHVSPRESHQRFDR